MDDVNKDCIDIFHSNEHEELYTFKEHQRNSLEQLKLMCRVQVTHIKQRVMSLQAPLPPVLRQQRKKDLKKKI